MGHLLAFQSEMGDKTELNCIQNAYSSILMEFEIILIRLREVDIPQQKLMVSNSVLIVHILKLYKVIKTFSCHNNGFDSWGINQ